MKAKFYRRAHTPGWPHKRLGVEGFVSLLLCLVFVSLRVWAHAKRCQPAVLLRGCWQWRQSVTKRKFFLPVLPAAGV